MSDTVSRRAMGIIAMGATAFGLGAVAVNSVGYLAPAIQDDLDIGRGMVGAVSSVFFATSGLSSLVLPPVAVRLGTRITVAVSLAAISLGATFAALSGTLISLFAFTALGGCAHALITMATNSAVAAAVPLRRRALGLTTKTAGGPLLSAVYALVAGILVTSLGWRGVVATTAGLALLGAVAAIRVFEPVPVQVARRQTTERTALPRVVLLLAASGFLIGAGAQPLFTWLLPFLRDEVDLSSSTAGVVTAVATASGVIGMITVAVMSDRLGTHLRLVVLSATIAMGAMATATMIFATPGRVGMVFVAAIIGIISYTGAIGVLHTATVDVAPHAVERASGAVMAGFYIGGWLAPFGFGLLADAGGYDLAWACASGALVVATILAAAAIAGSRRELADQSGVRPQGI
jgi:predicted MFS family arabinose efflux permease